MHGQARNIGAGEEDFSRGRANAAADEVDQGRFARSVGSDDCPDFAPGDVEIHIVDGFHATEMAAQPARRKQAHGSHGATFSRTIPMRPRGNHRISPISASPTTSRYAEVWPLAISTR